MPDSHSRRTVGNLLLIVGLAVLLGVAGYFGWTQLQGARLRAELRQTASPTAPATLPPTASFAPTAPAPTAPPTAAVTAAVAPAIAAATVAAPDAASPAAAATSSQPSTDQSASAERSPAATVPPAAPPVRLVMPDLKIDAAVAPMSWQVIQTAEGPRSEWVVPDNEAGHHVDSVLLGQPGNLVISGHNNIFGKVFQPISFAWDSDQRVAVDDFTDRSDVLNGRQIQLFDASGRVYNYVVTEFYRLKDTGVPLQQRIANARFMQETSDTRLTLITCWPPTNNTHRLIVIAAPAP